jgi:hypothetical protein
VTRSPIPAQRIFAREVLRRPSLSTLVCDQDEWAALQAAHLRADEAAATIRAADPIPDLNILREVDQALRTNKPIPTDFAERQTKAQTVAALRAAELNALSALQGQYGSTMADIAEESIPEMIEALSDELRSVVDRGVELLADLNGNIDPLAAIESDKTEAFRELADLHRQYVRVRSDADLILGQEDRRVLDSDRALHRIMRGAARVWPTWRMVVTEYLPAGHRGPAGAPWPADVDSLEFFAWLLDHAEVAEPWVSSADDIRTQKAADARTAEDSYQARHPGPDAE